MDSSQDPAPYVQKGDSVKRGQKYSTPGGTALFIGLRLLDPILQYRLLSTGAAESFLLGIGVRPLFDGALSQTGTPIDALGLSPYRLFIVALAAVGSVKQLHWLLVTSEEAFPVGVALLVGVIQGFFTSLNTLLAVSAASSGSLPVASASTQGRLVLSGVLFVAGIFLELAPEKYRKRFKLNPRNKGKLCTESYWSIVRHPNYTGFILWRTGAGLAAGGWMGGALTFAAMFYSMAARAVPSLDGYASRKYGEKWAEYKKKTPYMMFPGIW